ncbi:MAG: hypothetical protein QGH66_03095 [Dehalococcoidia bacterium]|jgi:DNA polymerase (family 10)|nr:hypothetical protein [Dehalococcoidia bacterium]MDP7470087.1 hypothetical protein [Dehalococcoidia bacterium]
MKGEKSFKIRACWMAARTINGLLWEIEHYPDEEFNFRPSPDVGGAIAKKISELVSTCRLKYYEELRRKFPQGIYTPSSVAWAARKGTDD